MIFKCAGVSDMATLFNYNGTPPCIHLGNTVTSLLQPLFSAGQKGHTFPYKKNLKMRSPINAANGRILKFQTVESLNHYTFLENCPPTPPLSQHSTLSENTYFALEVKCWLRGGVSGQFPRNV